MKKLRNLKHIFAIFVLSLLFVFGSIMLFSRDFSNALNGFFVYRTTGGVWQDSIYKHAISPSYLAENKHGLPQTKIKIIKVDDESLNYLQANNIPF